MIAVADGLASHEKIHRVRDQSTFVTITGPAPRLNEISVRVQLDHGRRLVFFCPLRVESPVDEGAKRDRGNPRQDP
jgi:hypothetical protein